MEPIGGIRQAAGRIVPAVSKTGKRQFDAANFLGGANVPNHEFGHVSSLRAHHGTVHGKSFAIGGNRSPGGEIGKSLVPRHGGAEPTDLLAGAGIPEIERNLGIRRNEFAAVGGEREPHRIVGARAFEIEHGPACFQAPEANTRVAVGAGGGGKAAIRRQGKGAAIPAAKSTVVIDDAKALLLFPCFRVPPDKRMISVGIEGLFGGGSQNRLSVAQECDRHHGFQMAVEQRILVGDVGIPPVERLGQVAQYDDAVISRKSEAEDLRFRSVDQIKAFAGFDFPGLDGAAVSVVRGQHAAIGGELEREAAAPPSAAETASLPKKASRLLARLDIDEMECGHSATDGKRLAVRRENGVANLIV